MASDDAPGGDDHKSLERALESCRTYLLCVDGLTYEEIGRRRGYADTYARRVVGQVLGRLRSMIGE
jgi:hypothetical protein